MVIKLFFFYFTNMLIHNKRKEKEQDTQKYDDLKKKIIDI